MPQSPANREHFDVIIVGAGLSGIGAAHHLQQRCPGKSYAILEGRQAIGGTWDLFRYPGIRSDSDMYTLGYAFKPWREAKAIADGPSILRYIRETAEDGGIDRRIRFGHRVVRAEWSTPQSRWTVTAEHEGRVVTFTCSFLFACSGYYRYEQGYTPDFAGVSDFDGRLVHPQHWPADLDCAGKKVVVIGSGATAVTLVPSLATTAAHVTMLQRSPTYMVARPSEDGIANWLRARLPLRAAYAITRWKNVLLQLLFYNLARSRPEQVKRRLVDGVRGLLAPGYDIATHFTPKYRPWDQRLCLVPDADLFDAIRGGSASVVTGHIDTFTPTGLRLKDGRELEADVVVTATGLVLQLLGGIQVSVDSRVVDFSQTVSYKGMLYSDVPNFASAFGYTNASWTLKCDLTCEYVCRLLRHMDAKGFVQATPRTQGQVIDTVPWLDFTSGYVQRAMAAFPKQGKAAPWRLHQNYAKDLLAIRLAKIEDGVLELRRAADIARLAVAPAPPSGAATPVRAEAA